MIDLNNNGNCPSCDELLALKQYVGEYAINSDESIYETIDLMALELEMWRAKDKFANKQKAALTKALVKKLEDENLEIKDYGN